MKDELREALAAAIVSIRAPAEKDGKRCAPVVTMCDWLALGLGPEGDPKTAWAGIAPTVLTWDTEKSALSHVVEANRALASAYLAAVMGDEVAAQKYLGAVDYALGEPARHMEAFKKAYGPG